jgi:hypothetical protein
MVVIAKVIGNIKGAVMKKIDVFKGYEWMCPECNAVHFRLGNRPKQVYCEDCNTDFKVRIDKHFQRLLSAILAVWLLLMVFNAVSCTVNIADKQEPATVYEHDDVGQYEPILPSNPPPIHVGDVLVSDDGETATWVDSDSYVDVSADPLPFDTIQIEGFKGLKVIFDNCECECK